ncbi:hypothetical protein GWI33_019785 [Rhynchophorus ferrugineus]|uniref:Uncharacterized protein n=1 Tax=Rhynchophorus ferrugineus TaxID=354439 RepID=A0A834M058_RHYFE|nr:hypothetical protein GWI33_019785 [Rhynchophorus ferrugineus]
MFTFALLGLLILLIPDVNSTPAGQPEGELTQAFSGQGWRSARDGRSAPVCPYSPLEYGYDRESVVSALRRRLRNHLRWFMGWDWRDWLLAGPCSVICLSLFTLKF